MAVTYEPIATQTLTSAASDLTFSSIPNTYTDLVVVMSVIPTGTLGYAPWLQFNGSTATNYSFTYFGGTGSASSAGRVTSSTKAYTGYSVGLYGTSNVIVNINNYSNTSTYKPYLARINETGTGTYTGTGLLEGIWQGTSAINSIKIGVDTMQFNTGSTFTIYGIKAA